MSEKNIYNDIAQRTGGDIYIGVVGPVRTGKSTFIKRFMDSLVLPNIQNEASRERATDELPQSSAGRTIMTTEPKFIPENAVEVALPGNCTFRVRMIDCVGYIVPSSLGYIEDDQPRMVATPWFEEPIPFNMAAEIGTRKVINEHSTIGLVITTDGSISDIPREEYEEAEERVINELREIEKPFVVLLNCMHPESADATAMAAALSEKYGVPVIPVNCLELGEEQIRDIIARVLMEFPVREVSIDMPRWITTLAPDHWLRVAAYGAVRDAAEKVTRIRDVGQMADEIGKCEHVSRSSTEKIDLGTGTARLSVEIGQQLFYKVLAEMTGLTIDGEQDLMTTVIELAETSKAYRRVKDALDEVEATGYGIVMPQIEELTLEEPEIVRQGGRYGVRLRASAPSIHIVRDKKKSAFTLLQCEGVFYYLIYEKYTKNTVDKIGNMLYDIYVKY